MTAMFDQACQAVLHKMNPSYLLGRDLVVVGPHVDLLVGVHTREDEEHAGPPGAPHQQPTQPEDDGSLILLKTG